MEKKTKVIIGIVSGVAAIGLGFGVYKIRKNRHESGEQEESIIEDASSVVSDAVSNVTNVFVSPCDREPSFPIRKGQKSKGVKDVQKFINRFGGLPNKIKEDCDFGKNTLDAAQLGLRNAGSAYGTGISEQTYKDVILRSLNAGKLSTSSSWTSTSFD